MTFENVSNELLDYQRDCNDVIIALNDVQGSWHALGTQLNVLPTTLARILHIPSPDGTHFKHLSELISAWIRRERREDHPSWRQLCQALDAMKQWDLAAKIAQKHSVPGSVPANRKDEQITIAPSTRVTKATHHNEQTTVLPTKGKGTLEYRVFTNCYSDILEAMMNPLTLADKLLPEGFIPHDTHRNLSDHPVDQQRRNIMKCVSVKITQDSSNLYQFIHILENDPLMGHVVSTMKQQLPKDTTTVPYTAVTDRVGEGVSLEEPDHEPHTRGSNVVDKEGEAMLRHRPHESEPPTHVSNDKPTDKRLSSVNNVWSLLGAAFGGAVLVAIIAFIIYLAWAS